MTRQRLVVTFTLLAVLSAAAQDAANDSARLAFATASVKPNSSGTIGRGAIRLQPGGGFSATNATVRELVEYAYQRHAFDRREVTGGRRGLMLIVSTSSPKLPPSTPSTPMDRSERLPEFTVS
jgi:hypothetical protein